MELPKTKEELLEYIKNLLDEYDFTDITLRQEYNTNTDIFTGIIYPEEKMNIEIVVKKTNIK